MKKVMLVFVFGLLSTNCVYVEESYIGTNGSGAVRDADIDDPELVSNGGETRFTATLDLDLRGDDNDLELLSVWWENDEGSSSLRFEPRSVEIVSNEVEIDRHRESRETTYRGWLGQRIDDGSLCGEDGELTIEIRVSGDEGTERVTLTDDVEYDCD